MVALSYYGFATNDNEIKQCLAKIANELEAKHPGSNRIKVAILEFRTSENELTNFNQFIQDELNATYRNSKRFEVIDQNAINRLITTYGWDLNKGNSFHVYSELSELIFKTIGMVPNAFIYGQVNDNDQTITITGYLVPNGISSTNIYSRQTITSSALTDKLLGKPIRKTEPKPEPQVVIVEKPVIVEKEVVVEKPVYIEKEVVVEKPVYIEKPQPQTSSQKFADRIGDLEFEMTEVKSMGDRIEITLVVVNSKIDDNIAYMEARFIDMDGNEFNSHSGQNTFRNRSLIEGVPIKGTITFNDANVQRTQNIAVIEIKVYGTGNKHLGSLRFRNVPVTN
jgi:hypothetical protein